MFLFAPKIIILICSSNAPQVLIHQKHLHVFLVVERVEVGFNILYA